jgi:hypothetical protein
MCRESFSAVLTNGFDTILKCNFRGAIVGHDTLKSPEIVPQYAPYRLGAIAHWATDDRLALVLNRAGEILVFHKKQLRFVRRAGRWHFLTHKPVISQMGRSISNDVRTAVYSTCLDASFARTGACIGVVISKYANTWQNIAVSQKDYLSPPRSTKARVMSTIVCGQKFQDLGRQLRQELVAIDGATLIDHKGSILAVGAILKIEGGSDGGGRLAAAKELSKLGMGIKVSQDGSIVGYYDGIADPKFIVM